MTKNKFIGISAVPVEVSEKIMRFHRRNNWREDKEIRVNVNKYISIESFAIDREAVFWIVPASVYISFNMAIKHSEGFNLCKVSEAMMKTACITRDIKSITMAENELYVFFPDFIDFIMGVSELR